MSEDIKKIMFTVRNAPHGTIYVYEGLEVKLIMAAYDADISVVFMDDGVYSLKQGQNTDELGIKGFEKPTVCLSIMRLRMSMLTGNPWKTVA